MFNIIRTLKTLQGHATGIKSAALAHSYTLATFVILFNLLGFYALTLVAGFVNDFVVYPQILTDFALPIVTATITFCSIAVTTCLGATFIDSKKETEETTPQNQV